MILVAGGIKGGSGKTTVATNLCVMRSLAGAEVLLVDADEQETASDFTALRDERMDGKIGYTGVQLSGPNLRTQVKRLRGKYQDIIIDVGGRDTASQRAALSVCDLLVVPFVPRSFDIWTLERVSVLVDEMREANPSLRVFTFLNRADPRGEDNRETAELLQKAEAGSMLFIPPVLGTRKAFGNAAARGMAVSELRTDPKACEEMNALYSYIF